MEDNKEPKVKHRREKHASRMVTRIWDETPSKENPYLSESCRCHGYSVHDLMEKRSFVDTLYLLFLGELPSKDQARMLETLMIALINPGPRHPAARAAIYAGCGKTDRAHILPIALTVMGGAHLGGTEVADAMDFLNRHITEEPEAVLSGKGNTERPNEAGDRRIAPGFGSRFNGIEPFSANIAKSLLGLSGSGDFLRWGDDFAKKLNPMGMGWLSTGIAAAAFLDLGFSPPAGAGLFQLLSAPGLLAHGLEYCDKPLHAVPFLDEEHYTIEP